MSIIKAMYAGVSGLDAQGDALGIVGDNVANTSTIGFKRSRATFEDVLGGVANSPEATGAGVRLGRAQQIFAQGTIQNTGQATDCALSGDGFFVVRGNVGGVGGNFFTRAGQLTIRNDGVVANPAGLVVQGYAANPDGTFSSKIGDLQLSIAQLPPRATGKVSITANLDATATPPAEAWDPQNPAATSNMSTSLTAYDSLGKAHQIDVYFRAGGGGAWEMHAIARGDDVAGANPGENVEIATAALSFTEAGALADFQITNGGTVSFNGATANQALTFDLGNPIAEGGNGLGGTTQFGAPSAIASQHQDGYASGDLAGVKIDAEGVVSGIYSNGQTVAAGKIAVAKFGSNEGLGRAGQNLWVATQESGDPAIGAAGTGGRATLVSGALEQSNVDIAEQFVNLIVHQRAFQANSKTITTADQMLQELMMIKQ